MEHGNSPSLVERLSRDPVWMRRPLVEKFLHNLPTLVLVTVLFLLYGYFLAHKIDLVTADVGRHIKNGEIFLHDASVLERNFYSYTNPNFPVINHHWGSGLLFYLAWKLSGFVGVQLLFIALSFAAFFFFLKAARLYAPWSVAGLAALPAIFLLGERTEIRPEVFSYLFAGAFFYTLTLYRTRCYSSESWNNRRRYEKLLWLLPFIQIFWVNTHIYFLLGPLLIGAFLLDALIQNRAALARLFGIFVAAVGATLVNPFGHRALTGALTLFENFGYRLAENQSVWFLERFGMTNPNFLIFKLLFGVLILSYLITIYRNWRGVRFAHLFVAAGIGTLALLASRNLTLFGFFAVPLLASNVERAFPGRFSSVRLRDTATALAAVVLVLSVASTLPRYFPYWRTLGLGLEQGNNAAIEFVQKNGITGPIFNNYDIGGYLIFHLFPRERVFVDNRPEAYPAEFFQKVYIPMQESELVWKEQLEQHNFNTIVFSHRDATPWGQQFMIQRLQDPDWAPVFVDIRVVIFVRRIEKNRELIERFLLPPETFRISNPSEGV